MNGTQLIAMALLILLLLPPVIAAWELHTVPDACHIALALGGWGFATFERGAWAGTGAIVTGIACLLLLTAAVALMGRYWHLRLLSGGQIKFLAAGSVWLSWAHALAMVALALAGLLIAGALPMVLRNLRTRKTASPAPAMAPARPEFVPIAAIAMLAVQAQQLLA